MTRRLELLAYLCAFWLVLAVWATGSWWPAAGLAGLFLIPPTGRRT